MKIKYLGTILLTSVFGLSLTGTVLAQSESAKGPPCKVLSELGNP